MTADESSFEEMTSSDGHVTQDRDHVTAGEEGSGPVLEGTLILAPRRGSDTELEVDRGVESGCVVNQSSSAHWPLTQKKSAPIPIVSIYMFF